MKDAMTQDNLGIIGSLLYERIFTDINLVLVDQSKECMYIIYPLTKVVDILNSKVVFINNVETGHKFDEMNHRCGSK